MTIYLQYQAKSRVSKFGCIYLTMKYSYIQDSSKIQRLFFGKLVTPLPKLVTPLPKWVWLFCRHHPSKSAKRIKERIFKISFFLWNFYFRNFRALEKGPFLAWLWPSGSSGQFGPGSPWLVSSGQFGLGPSLFRDMGFRASDMEFRAKARDFFLTWSFVTVWPDPLV